MARGDALYAQPSTGSFDAWANRMEPVAIDRFMDVMAGRIPHPPGYPRPRVLPASELAARALAMRFNAPITHRKQVRRRMYAVWRQWTELGVVREVRGRIGAEGLTKLRHQSFLYAWALEFVAYVDRTLAAQQAPAQVGVSDVTPDPPRPSWTDRLGLRRLTRRSSAAGWPNL